MRKTLEQLNSEYGFKAEDFVVDGKEVQPPAFKKWLKAAWEIDNVYALVQAEEISLSKARELVTAIIEKHSSSPVQDPRIPIIPPMTDPLGKGWDQPKLEEIQLDHDHAYMNEKAFAMLKEYNTSTPTGVYEGKMWKRCIGEFYELCWWGKSSPGRCSLNSMKIMLK